MQNGMFSRRNLLKGSVLMLALSQVGSLGSKAWAQTKKLIDMSGKSKDAANTTAVNIAKGLGYVENAEAAEKAGKLKRVDKMGVPAKSQICFTCNFYKEVEKGKAGECTLIQGVLVHHSGYCNTWLKGPNYKA